MKRGAENTWPSPDLRPRPSHGPAARRRWPSTFKLIQIKSMTLETRAPPAAPPPQAASPTRSAPSPQKGGGLPLALLPQSETAKRGQRDWARTPPTAPAHGHTRGRPSPALTPARSRTTCPLSADARPALTDGPTLCGTHTAAVTVFRRCSSPKPGPTKPCSALSVRPAAAARWRQTLSHTVTTFTEQSPRLC